MTRHLLTTLTLGAAVILTFAAQAVARDDCTYGCCSVPACGKVCKLVCETQKLKSTGYGYECKTICIPGPSRRGCQHCYTTCCGDCPCGQCGCQGHCCVCQEQKPKISFCWYDWFACGCAKPRTVKVLTKYEAQHEICGYHWEVVDACDCCCPIESADEGQGEQAACRGIYKPAPSEAQLGEVIELTSEEKIKLASCVAGEHPNLAASLAQAADEMRQAQGPAEPVAAPASDSTADQPPTSAWQRLVGKLPLTQDTE